MIILLLHLLAWVPAIIGLGSVLLFVRKRISSIPGTEFEISEPWFGFVFLATISSFLNFFFPITRMVAAPLLVIGWGMAWYRFTKIGFTKSNVRNSVLALLWMILVSFWAAQPPINHDTGLYHYSSIRWINENSIPFGLANLHPRFGFNSVWFPLAAVLQWPFFDANGTHCFTISALLIYFFGIAVATSFAAIRAKQTSIDKIFLLLSVLIVLGNVFRRNISSPSPDLAILLLCIVVMYLALQTIQYSSDWTYKYFQVIVLSFFGIAIKFSSLPLLFLPLSLILLDRRKKIPFFAEKVAGYSFLFSGIITLVWLARGIVHSGCLVFPAVQSCFQGFSWTVPASITAGYGSLIKLTARFPHIQPPKAVTDWSWTGYWLREQLSSIDFVLSSGLLVAALITLFLARSRVKEMLWLIFSLIAAILFWFFTAPDMRFGAGYLWSLSLLILSMAIHGLHKASVAMRKIVPIILLSVILILIVPLRNQLYFGLPPLRKAFRNIREFLFILPVPASETETRLSVDGIPVHLPVKGQDCWFSELPCTPFLYENLRIEKSPDGSFTKFYFP